MRVGDNQYGTKGPPIGGGSLVFTADAADMLSVGPRTVERARAVHDHAVPELREKAEAGTVSVAVAGPASRHSEPNVIASAWG
ncbi:MAG: hypothetical protein AAF526_01760 [Pseudomonadota bacterium]